MQGTPVGDFVTATPVFYQGKHMFWSVIKGHQLDCGAYEATSVAPSAKDVWQEALQIPPIKFYEKGEPRQDVIDLYLANVRYQELLSGDLKAQLGSIWNGKRRMIELVDEYGPEEIMRYVEAILDYADRRTADEIRSMPDGKYYAEGYVDTDGAGNTDLKVAVTLNIDDDKIHADFTGSAPQEAVELMVPRVLWKRLREFQSFAQSMRKYHIMMVVCGTLPVTLQRGPL